MWKVVNIRTGAIQSVWKSVFEAHEVAKRLNKLNCDQYRIQQRVEFI